MSVTTIAYEDIERFFDHVECLEAIANAARVYEQAVREEASFRECGKLFSALTEALDKEEKDSVK